MTEIRKGVEVSGLVQGVGFRPYVFRLAGECGLRGTIANTSAGVAIEIQGQQPAIEQFLARLEREAPPLARITGVAVYELARRSEAGFRILASRDGEERRTLIAPDVAVCDDCRRELFDPADRRYRYPFINCTNCGPRYTIVRDLPYDRPRTSMAPFRMCAACQAEYDDRANRRFHAQPNACWECGPQVELWDRAGRLVPCADPIAAAAALLREGRVVAVKGLGGFHLAADATNAGAVALLRERKRRVEKPFAVMAPDLETIRKICRVDESAAQLLARPERPIVVLEKCIPNPVSDEVAPFNRTLGVFLPYTPLHYLLFDAGKFPALVMTSGNLSEEPIAIDNREAVERLAELADAFLVHNRDILLRSDDSVVRPSGGRVRQWRPARGIVPVPVFLAKDLPPILAVGGELKDTLCLAQGPRAFLSQHVGDLENLESYRFFEDVGALLKRILGIEPRVIAYDLHPDYFSTRWALAQQGVEKVGVQHHHAHVAACMAEHHLSGRVIGLALDGTGFGTDGCIWGGEALVASAAGFERVGHLNYVPMPGGAAAIREPWRMAVAYLYQHCGRAFLERDIPWVRSLSASRLEVVLRMIEKGVNAPLTSSCGRLFDAVAALAGIRQRVNYEAQAAIELEMCLERSEDADAYPMDLDAEGEGWIVDTRPLFAALLDDLARHASTGTISRRFHQGLVRALGELAKRLRERHKLNRVCLSGGTFQNVFLLESLTARLQAAGFEVFAHAEVPTGDGGLSLGQAWVAAHVSGSKLPSAAFSAP